jgi:histidinol dehydrogenase
MPVRLHTGAPGFAKDFAALIDAKREMAVDVDQVVAKILNDVRIQGDEALLALTRRFDWDAPSIAATRVSDAELDAATKAVPAATLAAFSHAARRIADYHQRQIPADARWIDSSGVELGWRWTALDSVGLYVPGGTAALSSSVLMNAIPAKVAGVKRLVMVTPTPNGRLDSATLAAATLAGVDEIWRIGGAQAVAALAYGTATIGAVDKIVGPGNAYVAAAKRHVFGAVGIDMVAGPSEILIVADGANNPEWIAADLLSQAEHDESAQSILITDDRDFADAAEAAVARLLPSLSRAAIAGRSWADHGAIIVVDDLALAPDLVNRIAPEHLELAVDDPDALAAKIRHAGAIFLGRLTPEAAGDYIAGANHVLPTARSARFASGLSTLDFLKRTSLMRLSPQGLATIGPDGALMADAEELPAHALSLRIRQ